MALFFLDRLSTGSLLGNIIAIISGVTLATLVPITLRTFRKTPGRSTPSFWATL